MQKLPMIDARAEGDTLLALAQGAGFGAAFAGDWTGYVKAQWKSLHARLGAGRDFDTFWSDALQHGGVWEDAPATNVRWSGTPAFAAPQLKGAGDVSLVLYASPSFYDGRG